MLQHTATHCNKYPREMPPPCCAFGLVGVTHCNTLQYTTTNCNTLQHTATYCNILQHTATSVFPRNASTLQRVLGWWVRHIAIHCNKLQHAATRCNTPQPLSPREMPPPCSAFGLVGVGRYNTLQHTTTHYNTLQHTATHYNSLQHTTTH